MTEQTTISIEGLSKKLDAVIDHTATHFGVLETQTKATSDVLQQLSNDFVESSGGLDKRVTQIGEQAAKWREETMTLIQPVAVPVELYAELIAAQGEIRNADKNTDNEFTHKKYADLASVMDAVRGPLSNNGLAIIQTTATIAEVAIVEKNPGAIGIKTTLVHESGQSIVDITAMVPEKFSPQGIGSCRTYMRRYAVLAICAIAGATDDDAEGATNNPNDYPRISTAEAEKIVYTADELFGDRSDEALKKMLFTVFSGLTVVGDIKEGEHGVALEALKNSKKLMDKNLKDVKAKEKAAAKKAAEEK